MKVISKKLEWIATIYFRLLWLKPTMKWNVTTIHFRLELPEFRNLFIISWIIWKINSIFKY